MKTSVFDYELPPELIAARPLAGRDQSRMLVVHRREGALEHRRFADLPGYLRAGDLLVVNDTRVIPARVFGRKAASGGKVELLLLEEIRPGTWDILLHSSRRPKVGSLISLGDGQAVAVLLDDGEKGRATVRIESERPWLQLLEEIGEPPLPPYILAARKSQAESCSDRSLLAQRGGAVSRAADQERYQTVYARDPGAVAAPTAGLHFTPAVFEKLEQQGIGRASVTLHVGVGTFRPVDAENVEEHRMEAERYTVSAEAAGQIGAAREKGGRIVAVGSTTVRTLETVAAEHGRIVPCSGRSSLFIYPPYEFRAVDLLLTNFHLPKSTLIMMVCALGGTELIRHAYEEAVKERYRFYSYGDCMLIV